MEKKFTPMKKNDVVNKFKNALLNGDIIRYDSDHTCVEVLPRTLLPKVESSDNLFQHSGSLRDYYEDKSIKKNTICISGNLLWETIKEMEKEYVMAKVFCSGSGCCQYATWAVYLQ